jgi:hypothetical protein
VPEKSPQKRSAKKAGRSIKEKRADKKAKTEGPPPIGFKPAGGAPKPGRS